ncbi:uncharacterized LCDV1 paralog family 1 [Lymphocystis disease virus 1]|uniref:uncharacterized LCDV1 paralog family 1 n=1 Tax=Fish lymphocystis disease virus TaxID=36363 RepID=UPI0000161EF0|nr:uncharacterized LCDV1 paralog family 1 [Lymphocystis disease virus 1]
MFKCFYCEQGFWYICSNCLYSKNFTIVLNMFINKAIKELTLLNLYGTYDDDCLFLIKTLMILLKPIATHNNFYFYFMPKQKPTIPLLKEAVQGLILIFKHKDLILFENNLKSITELYNTCTLMYLLNNY